MKKGFTIIELIITTTLMAVVGAAITAVFMRGLQVWERARMSNQLELDAKFSLEKMAKELRNTYAFQGIPFSGKESEVSFPSYVQRVDAEKSVPREIGTISYFMNSSEKALMRLQKPYDELFQHFQEPQAKVALSPIEGFKVQYYHFNMTLKLYEWKDSWEEPGHAPLGIRFVLTIRKGKEDKSFIKMVILPVDFSAEKKEEKQTL